MKNQSFYAIVLTLLMLISVAVWQFFSLVARSDGLHDPYTAGGPDGKLGRPTLAVTPK